LNRLLRTLKILNETSVWVCIRLLITGLKLVALLKLNLLKLVPHDFLVD